MVRKVIGIRGIPVGVRNIRRHQAVKGRLDFSWQIAWWRVAVLRVEEPKEVVEGPVFQHYNHDILDLRESVGHGRLLSRWDVG